QDTLRFLQRGAAVRAHLVDEKDSGILDGDVDESEAVLGENLGRRLKRLCGIQTSGRFLDPEAFGEPAQGVRIGGLLERPEWRQPVPTRWLQPAIGKADIFQRQ